MIIRSITLKNIRCYAERRIDFEPGVNFISGRNGSGKSTIFAALGYALFDRPPGPLKDFLRMGATSGSIQVLFSDQAGTPWRVVRKLGRSPSWEAYALDDTRVPLYGERDMLRWLGERMGVEPHRSLSDLFADVVGVAQGQFTVPFAETAKVRQKHFDRIFGVEAYRESFDRLRETVNRLHERIAGLTGRNQTVLEDLKKLPELDQLQKQILAQLDELHAAFPLLIQEIKAQEALLAQCEQARAHRDEATQQLTQAEHALALCQSQYVDLSRRCDICKADAAACRTLQTHYEQYVKAQRERAQLAAMRAQRDTIQSRIDKADKQIEQQLAQQHFGQQSALQARQRAQAAQSVAASLQVHNQRAGRLHDYGARMRLLMQQTLEQAENEAMQARQAYEDGQAIVARIRNGIEQWQQNTESISRLRHDLESMDKLHKHAGGYEQARKDDAQARDTLASLKERLAARQAERDSLQDGLCPYARRPCTTIEGGLAQFLTHQIKALQGELSVQETICRRTAAALEHSLLAVNQLSALEQKREQMEQEAVLRGKLQTAFDHCLQVLEENALTARMRPCCPCLRMEDQQAAALEEGMAQWLQAAGDILAGQQAVLERYTAFLSRFISWESALKAGQKAQESRREQALLALQGEQEQQAQHDERARAAQLEVDQLGQQRRSLALELAPYVKLDGQLAAHEAVLEKLQPQYDQYIAAQRQAQQLEDLLEQARHKQAEIDVLIGRVASTREQVTLAQQAYNPETLATARQQRERLLMQQAECDSRHLHLKESWQAAQEQREILMHKQQQLLADQRQLARYEMFLQTLEMMRNVYNQAGERIAQRYCRYISAQADNIYRTMTDEPVSLSWDQGYEIRLFVYEGDRIYARSFTQLSGGQQMAAALAVRLAMLHELSRLNLCFFDEPTTNLDRQRRNELAMLIPRATHGFDQVFIISHDEVFDAMTEHVVELQNME